MIQILKPNFEFGDERGKLTQLVREGYKQINVITSNKGCYRGGHFHKVNKECFYIISGEIELTVTDGLVEKKYIFKENDMFLIEENIKHSFLFKEDTLLVSMYSNGVELANGEKDIY